MENTKTQEFMDGIEKSATLVILNRAEGYTDECGVSAFMGIDKAEAAIRKMARTAPIGGGYDKVDFMLVQRGDCGNGYNDEVLYSGRFDMENEHKDAKTPLRDWMRSFLDYQFDKEDKEARLGLTL